VAGSAAASAERADAEWPDGIPADAAPSDEVWKAATVLVVDDERDIRFLVRFVLEKNGFRVIEAVHGASALDVIRNERPALVITDLMMPVMDGSTLIDSLRDTNDVPHIPTILVTACPERAPQDHFDRVMRKPFLPSDLVATVQELLEGHSA